MGIDLFKIKAAARADRIKWRYHALLRAYERGITRETVRRVIEAGEIIEQYHEDHPYPSCLMMAMVEADKPLDVALGYSQDSDYVYIITVHWLDPKKWEDPWTRKPTKPKLERGQ